jgi:RNA polymerase sigma-70 factor (ECF subfamily)
VSAPSELLDDVRRALGDAPDGLVRHVAAKIDDAEGLARLRLDDLRLAWACAEGDAAALARFEREHLRGVTPAFQAAGLGDLFDDVAQKLRVKLVVDKEILGYGGRGDLQSWLRTVALRAAWKLAEAARRAAPLDEDMLLALPAPGDDPETERLKQVYAPEFKAALREALAGLERRDRNLLRQAFIDGLTIDQLAPLYRVHRATAARWLAAARAALLGATEKLLRARLGVGPPELESLWALVRSRLDLSAL